MIKIKYDKQKLAAALCMTCLGGVTGAVSQNYPFLYEKSEPAALEEAQTDRQEARELPAFSPKATPSDASKIPEERPFVFIPYSGQLNLAYFYPEGADESDRLNSYAGSVFKNLTRRDAEWMAEIYDLSGREPEQLANSLGRSSDSVRGHFNPKDENQKQDVPESWLIRSWKRVNLAFFDENGRQIPAYSNVKDILSMASVYTYYAGLEDHGLFESYAQELWKASHSYSYSISDVYYCDGCLNGEDSEVSDESGLADEEAEDISGGSDASGTAKAPGAEEKRGQENAGQDTAEEAPPESGQSSDASPQQSLDASPQQPSAALPQQSSDASPQQPKAGEAAGSPAPESREETAAAGYESRSRQAGSEVEIGPGVALASPSGASYAKEQTSGAASLTGNHMDGENALSAGDKVQPEIKCPGHVDLNIYVTIAGIDGLFRKDPVGNSRNNIKEGGWSGWDTYNRYYAKRISGQDWLEEYGLSVTEICVRNPLSAGEIESYMALLPESTSEDRRKLIQFALSSVGRIPYYWGGKPEAGNYEGNAFCSLMLPDEKGRSLRGLDCSGWINWVYWSALGMRLPYEGTDGLAIYGTSIRREELKPGDIIVKRGSSAHVVMFLSWEQDGRMQVIHETSGGINNVTVSAMNADWPYYRRILD